MTSSKCLLDIVALATLTLALGLLLVAFIPPWQIPDEPRHFEYIRALWLERNASEVSEAAIELEVISSMKDHQWWQATRADLYDKEPDRLGAIALLHNSSSPRGRHPDLYYRANALLIDVLSVADLASQLYIARSVSVFLGLVVVLASYATARLIFLGNASVPLLVGMVVSLLPQRAFVAAGVNNDNLAAAAGSLAFLSVAMMVMRGCSLPSCALAGLSCVLVVLSKPTAFVVLAAFPLAGIVVGVAALHQKARARHVLAAYALGAAMVAVAGLAAVDPGCNASGWEKHGFLSCTRFVLDEEPLKSVIRVEDSSTLAYEGLSQRLRVESIAPLRGGPATMGFWGRTASGTGSAYYHVFEGAVRQTKVFTVDEEWKFVSRNVFVDQSTTALTLNFGAAAGSPSAVGEIWIRDVVLVEGEWDESPPPKVSGDGTVWWDGQPLRNAVVNPSGQHAAPGLRPWVLAIARHTGMPRMVAALEYLLDPGSGEEVSWGFVLEYAKVAVDSFWGMFGWMNVALDDTLYLALRLATAIGLVGVLFAVVRPEASATLGNNRIVEILALCLLIVLLAFVMLVMRQLPPEGAPQGRYALPAIAPFAVAMVGGWVSLCPKFARRGLELAVAVLASVLMVGAIWAMYRWYLW